MAEVDGLSEVFLSEVFEEWKKRNDAHPEDFMLGLQMEDMAPATYGPMCAQYFLWLVADMQIKGD